MLIISVWKTIVSEVHLLEYLLFWGRIWYALSAKPHASCRILMQITEEFNVGIMVVTKIFLICFSVNAGSERVTTFSAGALGVKEVVVILPPRHVAIEAALSTNIDILNLEQRKVCKLESKCLSFFSIIWEVNWLRLYRPRNLFNTLSEPCILNWTSTPETIPLTAITLTNANTQRGILSYEWSCLSHLFFNTLVGAAPLRWFEAMQSDRHCCVVGHTSIYRVTQNILSNFQLIFILYPFYYTFLMHV